MTPNKLKFSKNNKQTSKKELRWTWRKPKGKPCRPLSAYNLFFAKVRKEMLEAHKDSGGFGNLARTVSEKWKNISSEEKSEFQRQANAEKAKYEEALVEWKGHKEDEKNRQECLSSDQSASTHAAQEEIGAASILSEGQNPPVPESHPSVMPDASFTDLPFADGFLHNEAGFSFPESIDATSYYEEVAGIAVVTEGNSEIGMAVSRKIASFPFIDFVLSISTSAAPAGMDGTSKIKSVAADIFTEEGRQVVLQAVNNFCNNYGRKRQLRFLVCNASKIDQFSTAFDVQADEMHRAMVEECEAPYFLITSLYPYMVCANNLGASGRVLNLFSENEPPIGQPGMSVNQIARAAFLESCRALNNEFRGLGGGKVVIGSLKTRADNYPMMNPCSVDISPFGDIPISACKMSVDEKQRYETSWETISDSLEDLANFVAFLLLETSDSSFGNDGIPNEM